MGDPEDVIKFLRMARVGIIGAFVLVLDLGTRGLRCRPLFSSYVGGAAVDGAAGGLWEGRVGEGKWESKQHGSGQNQEQAENFLTHLVLRTEF